MTPVILKSPGKPLIRIGYRSPGLSAECTPAQKMELGMEVIEPQLADKEFPEMKIAGEYRHQTDQADIRIKTAGSAIQLASTTSRQELDGQIDRVQRFADLLGFSYVFNCVEFPPDGRPQAEVWDRLVANVRCCLERFGQAGLRFALEPEWFIASSERMGRLCRLVGSEDLLVNYGPTNFYLGGSDPIEALDTFSGKIRQRPHQRRRLLCKRTAETSRGRRGTRLSGNFHRHGGLKGISLNMHIEHCGSSAAVRAAVEHIRPLLEDLQAEQKNHEKVSEPLPS